jgi:hypothetical protein
LLIIRSCLFPHERIIGLWIRHGLKRSIELVVVG